MGSRKQSVSSLNSDFRSTTDNELCVVDYFDSKMSECSSVTGSCLSATSTNNSTTNGLSKYTTDATTREEKRKSVHLWLNSDSMNQLVGKNNETVVIQGEIEMFDAQPYHLGAELYERVDDAASSASSRPPSPSSRRPSTASNERRLSEHRRSISDSALESLKNKLLHEIKTKDDPRMYRTHSLIQYWKQQEQTTSDPFASDSEKCVVEPVEIISTTTSRKSKASFRRAKQQSSRRTTSRFRLKAQYSEVDHPEPPSDKSVKRKKSFFGGRSSRARADSLTVPEPKKLRERKHSWGSLKGALSGIKSPIMRRRVTEDGSSCESSSCVNHNPEDTDEKFRIVQIQGKFPHDKLDLNLSLEEQERNSRRFTSQSSHSPSVRRKNPNLAPEFEFERKPSSDDLNYGGTSPSSQRRLYIQEGAVKLSSTTSTNERYIFLFHDLLLLSKVKSTSSYKLKEKVRVSEVWLSPNIDEVAEATLSTDKSFTIGWPTTNYVATFCSPEEKELWYKALQKCIDDQLESIEPKELSINITNKCNADDTTPPQTATLSITSRQDVKTVIKMAQEHFQIQPEEQYTYQLWISAKDIPHSLLGHERPYAIKANFARMFPDVQGNTVRDDNEHQHQEMGLSTLETSCQFFLKKNKQGTGRINLDLNNSQRKWKNPMKKSPIYNWAMNKKTIKYQPSLYDNVSPGKLFGNPLTALSTEEELVPSPVQNILVELFRRGPGTTGIFRKSALQRTAKQIRQNLDAGKEENFEDISIIVLASVLKDFFRSLPDCLLVSALYDNFVGTKSTTENETRVVEIKKILPFLPREHYETLMRLICVLYHIQRFSDRNNMNSYNLSICISQSIMWPPTSSKLEATEQTSRTSDFVCFLIDNYVQVFGADNEFLLGQESEIQFNEGAGEDSDSGTDQHVYSLRQDTEEENNDSEKENELPLLPSDSVFTPTKGDLDSPFAHSDSSICTNDSDDRETRVSQESGSLAIPSYQPAPRSTPSSPLNQRREMDDSINARNMSDVSDYEITDYNEIFQRKLLRQPRHKRVLSSTTTSAELIEHKRHAEANDRKASRKKSNKISFSSENLNKNSNNSDKGTSEIVPKKYVISQPVIKHFTTEYANSPNVIFHSVDRRRQPAAPSYEEHIQRTQASKNATVTNIVRKKSIPPSKVQQLSVEDYRPSLLRSEYDIDYKNEVKLVESVEPVVVPVVSVAVGNKTESTSKVENASVIDDNKTEVSQTNPPKAELQNSPKSELQNAPKTELQSSPKADSPKVDLENAPKKDFQKYDNSSDCSKPVTSKNTNLTKLNTHKSPNRVDSLIEAFQVKCAPNNVKEAQSTLRNQIRAAVNKINSLDNFDIAPVFLERDAKEIEQSNNARRSDSPLMKPSPVAQQENVKVASIVLNERDSRPKKDFVEEVIEASTHDPPRQNPLDVIDTLKMSLDETLSESTSDNDTVVEVLPSPQKPKLLHDNNNDTNEFDRNTIETSDLIEENNLTPPSSEGPFSLKLKAEVRKTPAIALPELQKSQSLQLKKTCLTQAPKKIDQLTTKNVMVKEESPRAISARELRRTNRRLKNEIRNAFNDGNFTFCKQDALANRFLVNGGTRTAPVVWKCGEKENVFNKKKLRYNDTIGRLQSKSILSHDESYV